MTTRAGDLTIERAGAGDLAEAIAVCGEALGWDDAHPNEDFFRWKHLENGFGESYVWIARDPGSGRIAGVRPMMRWRLVHRDGRRLEMVRAVDTATAPDYQGRGIFSTLTTRAVDDMSAAGVGAVFNSPNHKSAPGYLKLGWREIGELTITMRPASVHGVAGLPSARTAADKWGEPCTSGHHPADVFADEAGTAAALRATPRPRGWSTDHDVATLRWRFGFEPLNYRVALVGSSVSEGLLVYRVRRRGGLRELDVNEVIGNVAAPRLARMVHRIARQTRADLILSTPTSAGVRSGLVPVPRLGPLLTWRPLAFETVPSAGELSLSMATLELF